MPEADMKKKFKGILEDSLVAGAEGGLENTFKGLGGIKLPVGGKPLGESSIDELLARFLPKFFSRSALPKIGGKPSVLHQKPETVKMRVPNPQNAKKPT